MREGEIERKLILGAKGYSQNAAFQVRIFFIPALYSPCPRLTRTTRARHGRQIAVSMLSEKEPITLNLLIHTVCTVLKGT